MASKPLPASKPNLKTILFFTIILSLISLLQVLSLKYPTAFTLNNENIFIIHSLGIDICDPLFTTNSPKLVFTSELTESDLKKMAKSRYDSGEFLLLIQNTIYIFDENRQSIISGSLPISLNGVYYSLSADKVVHQSGIDYYYFLLGYIDKSSYVLNLYYFYLDSDTQTIIPVISNTEYVDDFRNTGLSCEFLKDEEKNDHYIFCIYERYISGFWEDTIGIVFSIFKKGEDSIEYSSRKNFNTLNLKYIRSTTKSKDSKPFFCGLNVDSTPMCLIYSYYDFTHVYKEEDGEDYFYFEPYENNCVEKTYNIKTYYFSETDEYVFSCLTINYGIQTTIYNSNMEKIEDIETPLYRLQRSFTDCNEFYYSIIYSNAKKDIM